MVFDQDADGEVLDGVAVLAGSSARPIERQRPTAALMPAVVQTVAIIGASVVAGAATVAIAHRRKARRVARRRRRRMLGPVLASRSFVVDVHVLGERGR